MVQSVLDKKNEYLWQTAYSASWHIWHVTVALRAVLVFNQSSSPFLFFFFCGKWPRTPPPAEGWVVQRTPTGLSSGVCLRETDSLCGWSAYVWHHRMQVIESIVQCMTLCLRHRIYNKSVFAVWILVCIEYWQWILALGFIGRFARHNYFYSLNILH